MTEKKMSDVLPGVLKNIGHKKGYERTDGIIDWDKIWAEIAGDARAHSYVVSQSNDILVIAVKNSAWVMELKKREQVFLQMLQERTGRKIRKLKFIR